MPKRILIQCQTVVSRDAVRHETIDGIEHIIITSRTLPDNIVMNGGLYPAEEIAKGFASLERTLAPVEHPLNANGQFISATDPTALHNFYAGAFNQNVRQEDGRVVIDKVINVVEANKSDRGKRLLDRVAELETNEKARPIHTSVGVFVNVEELDAPQTNTAGDEFTWIARDMVFDHDAILLDSVGAAQPHQGVGMAVNADGDEVEVQQALILIEADDHSDMSHSEIHEALAKAISEPPFSGDWVTEVFEDTVIYWVDDLLFSAPYILVDGVAKITGLPIPVDREVTYIPKVNTMRLTLNYLKTLGVVVNGALADRLTSLIDRKASDDDDRSSIIDDMASAAGISRSTVLQILRGDIEAPPEDRLEGFATTLGVSLKSLQDLLPNNEGDTMNKLMLKALADAGIKVNANISDADLLVEYNKLQANQDPDEAAAAAAATGDDDAAAAGVTEAVTNALKPVTDKLDSLEAKINKQDVDELNRLATIIANSEAYPGIDEDAAKKLGVKTLKGMAATLQTSHGVPLHINEDGSVDEAHSYDMPK